MRKRYVQWLALSMGLWMALLFSSSSHAAISEGNILDGHADIPTDQDRASNKYAVIAQFGTKTDLILSGTPTRTMDTGLEAFVELSDEYKGKPKALYTNVGSYKGRSLDFELIVYDWEEAGFKSGEYFFFYDDRIAFEQNGYNFVSFKGTYKYSDTGEAATDLTGSYMTVNDLDAYQSIAFDNNMMNKIDHIYASEDSVVSYWETGGKANMGAKFPEGIDEDDERGTITLLVDGYTFDFDWNKDYSKKTSNGNDYGFGHIKWERGKGGQYFGYISEKPVRTEVLEPTKKIIKSNGEQANTNEITPEDSYTYEVYHTVPSEYPKFFYDSYQMKDVIHGALSIDDVVIYDAGDQDVSNRFDITIDHHTITATAKSDALRNKTFYGQDYRMVIKVTAKSVTEWLDEAEGADEVTVTNTATVTIEGSEKTTNDVTTIVLLPKTSISMEKIQIFTNKADEGLPVRLVLQTDNIQEAYQEESVDIELYEKQADNRTRVATKEITVEDTAETISMVIPDDVLQQDSVHTYEAVLANENEQRIHITDEARTIETDGYTAKEGMITSEETFIGVTMTERKLGEDMQTYQEKLTVTYEPTSQVKTGYGIEVAGDIRYENEQMEAVLNEVSMARTVGATIKIDHRLIDPSLSYHDQDQDRFFIPLLEQSNEETNVSQVSYQLPQVFMAHETGLTYTQEQKENGEGSGDLVNAGHRLYIPVWLPTLGNYSVDLQSTAPIGSNFMDIQVDSMVHVYAHMFHHSDSETPEADELLLHPIQQDEASWDW